MQKITINCQTGEKMEEQFTALEIAEIEQKAQEQKSLLLNEQLAKDAALEARQSGLDKLLALGLTTEDLKALLG